MSQNLGSVAEFHNERFLAALRQIVDAARRHGLAMAAQPRNLQQVQEWLEIGVDVVLLGADVNVYLETISAAVKEVNTLTATPREKGA